MKKALFSLIILVCLVSFVGATPINVTKENNGNSGSIWTTKNDCGTSQQDVNQYNIGEKVYINGDNFVGGTKAWTITGQPGGASCDPATIVASGNYTIDSSGNFCFEAYTINLNDCGVYKVDFNGKNDNYHINLDAPIVPEFGLIVGALTIFGAIGVFFVIRSK